MKAKRQRRQIFVLTPEEKKVIACILAALALGLVTKHYRAEHPRPPPPLTAQEKRAAKLAQHSAAAQERAARTATAARAMPSPTRSDDDEE